jgi:hypothetical protein
LVPVLEQGSRSGLEDRDDVRARLVKALFAQRDHVLLILPIDLTKGVLAAAKNFSNFITSIFERLPSFAKEVHLGGNVECFAERTLRLTALSLGLIDLNLPRLFVTPGAFKLGMNYA